MALREFDSEFSETYKEAIRDMLPKEESEA